MLWILKWIVNNWIVIFVDIKLNQYSYNSSLQSAVIQGIQAYRDAQVLGVHYNIGGQSSETKLTDNSIVKAPGLTQSYLRSFKQWMLRMCLLICQ